jgi:hypothetical protein
MEVSSTKRLNRNIRSDSILFFPAPSITPRSPPGPSTSIPQAIGYSEPLFVGLSRARVDDVVKDRLAYYVDDDDDEPSFGHPKERSKRKNDINLDYYQHPDKRYDRSIRYSRSHDIYSLGCVLLEIGLWKPLDELVDIDDDDYDKTKREFQALSANLNGLVFFEAHGTIH